MMEFEKEEDLFAYTVTYKITLQKSELLSLNLTQKIYIENALRQKKLSKVFKLLMGMMERYEDHGDFSMVKEKKGTAKKVGTSNMVSSIRKILIGEE